jgi:hypothetical protein
MRVQERTREREELERCSRLQSNKESTDWLIAIPSYEGLAERKAST